jgi:hypothetical protein
MRRGARRSLVRVFSLTKRFYPFAGGINVVDEPSAISFQPSVLPGVTALRFRFSAAYARDTA